MDDTNGAFEIILTGTGFLNLHLKQQQLQRCN